MKKLVFIFLLFAIPAGAQTRSYTLQEVLAEGLERNYSVRIARGESAVATNNATAGNAGFFPQVGVAAGYGVASDNTREDGAQTQTGVVTRTASAGLDATWTLGNGFSVIADWKRLRELETMGELGARIAIEDFVATLTAEYYNFIQQTIRLRNYRYAVALSRERLRIVEARYLLGGGSRLDVLQARVDYNADSSLLITQQERIIASRIAVNELIAADDVDERFAVRDSLIDIDDGLRLDELRGRMEVESAELQHAERSGRLAELDRRKIRSRVYPALRFDAGYGYAANAYDRGGVRKRHTWGPDAAVTLGFTIFDGRRGTEIRSARIEAENALLRVRQIETMLNADLATFWQAYLNNLGLLALERQNLASARQNYEIARERYMLGDLSGIEMREAQKSLLDAEERILVAQYDTKMCEISLLQISGQALRYASVAR